MAKQIMSRKKAISLSFVIFLIGLALISYFNYWWPGIMIVIGIPLATRQYLLGKYYDCIISLVVFFGVFIAVQFKIHWQLLLPILFVLGAIYIFFRDFIESKEVTEVEREEDITVEIEEEKKEKKK